MTSLLEPALRELGRARFWAGFARRLGFGLVVALLAAGCVALLGRLLLGWSSVQAAWALLAALGAPVYGFWGARRDRWDDPQGAAWLDVSAGGDGSLVTESQVSDERWRERATAALSRTGSLAGPQWGPVLTRGALGAAFAIAALLVPMPAPVTSNAGMFRGTLADLEETLEMLEEDAGLDETKAQELAERLDQLREEAEAGSEPEATFEAMDALAKDLEQEAAEIADALEEAASQLAQGSGDGEGQEYGEALEGDLQAALERLDEGGILPPDLLDLEALELPEGLTLPEGFEWPEGMEPGEFGDLSSDQLEGLSEALRDQLIERLEALSEAGLLANGPLRLAELREGMLMAGEGEPGELCEGCKQGLPCEEPGGMPCVGGALVLGPGTGVSRGRADAPMTWGDESSEQAVQFETHILPPDLEALRDSTLFGLGRVAPETFGQGESAGTTQVDASAGAAVTRRRLSPRHRRAVGTYFSSAKKQ